MGKRTAEMVLGILGGLAGIIFSFIAMFVGGVGGALGADGAETVVKLGVGGFVFALIGIIGGIVVKPSKKWGGWLLIVSAVGGLISISVFYILPFVFLFPAGLIALLKKTE